MCQDGGVSNVFTMQSCDMVDKYIDMRYIVPQTKLLGCFLNQRTTGRRAPNSNQPTLRDRLLHAPLVLDALSTIHDQGDVVVQWTTECSDFDQVNHRIKRQISHNSRIVTQKSRYGVEAYANRRQTAYLVAGVSYGAICATSFKLFSRFTRNEPRHTWSSIPLTSSSISSVISKVFEHCILHRFKHLFKTSDNQFGFKTGLGCSQAINVVRCVVDRLVKGGSTVNICSLDLSKAFDEMSHQSSFITHYS